MGLISRVSSRTYRKFRTKKMFSKALQTSLRSMRTFGRSRDRPQTRIHNPMFPKGYLPNGVRFAVFCSLYLGTVGLTHFIHSGTNAKYSEIRNTEMYAVIKETQSRKATRTG